MHIGNRNPEPLQVLLRYSFLLANFLAISFNFKPMLSMRNFIANQAIC